SPDLVCFFMSVLDRVWFIGFGHSAGSWRDFPRTALQTMVPRVLRHRAIRACELSGARKRGGDPAIHGRAGRFRGERLGDVVRGNEASAQEVGGGASADDLRLRGPGLQSSRSFATGPAAPRGLPQDFSGKNRQ